MSDAPETTAVTAQPQGGELRLAGPRLPYHPALEARYGIDRGTWKVLCEVLFPAAEAAESIIMAVSYCRARNLDIMKKPVHIVPVWDRKRARMVDTVWPAISETRITAMRTLHYAGKDETVFGPEITETLGGVEVTYPEWASVTVYRFVQGVRCPFTGERVRWREYYAKAKRDTLAPNDMWKTKSYSQISKCAEASALRCAFPEEDSGPTSDEMEGQEVSSTYAPSESLTGPGIMSRLAGNQHAEGFDHENGHATTEDARASVKGKRAARKAAAEALPAPTDEAPATPAAEGRKDVLAEVLGGDDVPAEGGTRPTETASAPSAGTGPDTSASATPASEASPPAEAASSPTDAGGAEPDVIAEGYPNANEVYMLNGDEWAFQDVWGEYRRDTYKNGEPLSDAGRDKGYRIYEDHAPAFDGNADAALPPDFEAYVDAVESAKAWSEVKSALQVFQKTEVWREMTEEVANRTRANTWNVLTERTVDWLPRPEEDVSAFRMWIETTTDASALENVQTALTASDAFKHASEGIQGAILKAAAARIAYLKG